MSFIITNIAHGWTGEAAGTRVTSAIRVEGDRIAEVGDLTPAPGEEVIDATGCVVIPGLVLDDRRTVGRKRLASIAEALTAQNHFMNAFPTLGTEAA